MQKAIELLAWKQAVTIMESRPYTRTKYLMKVLNIPENTAQQFKELHKKLTKQKAFKV